MTSEPDVSAVPVPQAPPDREDLPGPRCPAWLRRPALALMAALAGLSYAWALGQDPLEPWAATRAG